MHKNVGIRTGRATYISFWDQLNMQWGMMGILVHTTLKGNFFCKNGGRNPLLGFFGRSHQALENILGFGGWIGGIEGTL
jgi:hypothetical protein